MGVDGFRRLAENIRRIPGAMGIRTVRVYVVTRTWTGTHVGDGTSTDSEVELLEKGQPPRVATLSGEMIAVNQLPEGTVHIGPITPLHSGGGTNLETLIGHLTDTQERWLRLTGGVHRTEGEKYRVFDVSSDKAIHYTIRAHPHGRDVYIST